MSKICDLLPLWGPWRAQMDADRCARFPLLWRCRVQRASKSDHPTGRIQFDLSTVRSDRRQRLEQDEAFRGRYRMRSGIKGTNGCLKRLMGLGSSLRSGDKTGQFSDSAEAGWVESPSRVALRDFRVKTQRSALAEGACGSCVAATRS